LGIETSLYNGTLINADDADKKESLPLSFDLVQHECALNSSFIGYLGAGDSVPAPGSFSASRWGL
jgi:hypothetical protein